MLFCGICDTLWARGESRWARTRRPREARASCDPPQVKWRESCQQQRRGQKVGWGWGAAWVKGRRLETHREREMGSYLSTKWGWRGEQVRAGRTRGAWVPSAVRKLGLPARSTSRSHCRKMTPPQCRKLVRKDLKLIWPGFESLFCVISYKIFDKLISLNLNFFICKTDIMVSIWQGWPRTNLNVVCKRLAKCPIPGSGCTTSIGSLLYEVTVN